MEGLLLQFALLCRTGIVAHAAHLTSGAIVHVALLARGVATLDRLGSPPVSGFRTVLKKKTQGFSPPPRRKLRHRKT